MFAYLRGMLVEKNPSAVIIDCAGVGYDIKIPLCTFENLPDVNAEVKLLIHVHYNQDDGNRLFGFFSQIERDLFRLLISISRIGPRIALSVLSSLSVSEIVSSILSNNYKLLSTAPGLGLKSAQRLIIELKDKVQELEFDNAGSQNQAIIENEVFQQAESALLTLGFKIYEIHKAFREISYPKKVTTQEAIKLSIRYLYQKRNES